MLNNIIKTDKKIVMGASKIEQFIYESLTWDRLLDFFKQENSYLKTRLSEVVDITVDKDFLAYAEQFQNKFILKDELIDELQHDVNEQRERLTKNKGSILNGEEKISKAQKKLRNEMEYFEKEFIGLKNEFNRYLPTVV
ncbi:hypothetical protein LK994_01225 [Ferruginibacter lapsinanis]|uniref:hypothetical protein n=1 Tax=Ferruginibacter lapsinanis TaxID=563172 RepID=UPI001E3FB92B|nr:hypothetical protein [Ferruginibacter lapsinanis]UEG50095.1 hypothetical protein LK994_01225 [Ferruginibacter lapsinanis]